MQLLSLCWSLKLALSLVCRSIPFALILRTLSSRSTPIYNQQQPAVCELLHRTHTASSQRASSASLKAAVRSLTQTRPPHRQHGKCRPLPLPLHLLPSRCSNSRTIVAHLWLHTFVELPEALQTNAPDLSSRALTHFAFAHLQHTMIITRFANTRLFKRGT